MTKRFFTAILCLLAAASCTSTSPPAPIVAAGTHPLPATRPGQTQFNLRDYGATGDGKTKDTVAFQNALDQCALMSAHSSTDCEVLVPPGNYLIGSVVMHAHTTLKLSNGATITGSPDIADYPLTDIRWEGRWRIGHRALISASHADHIAILGPGHIVGANALGDLRNPRGPCLIEPIDCRFVLLDGFSTTYRRLWSTHLTYCQDVAARNLTIRSSRANGDGIDVDSCQRVQIDHCDIDTGDDCIAIKSGRGMEGYTLAKTTEDVAISDCTFASGFAGVGIGSEMSGGIRSVRIERCTFTRGDSGIYIKGNTVRGGFVQNIHGTDLTGQNTKVFLRINFLSSGIKDEEPVTGPAGIPTIADFRFANVKADCPTLVDARRISPDKPLDGLSLVNITGTCTHGIWLCNVKDAELRDLNVTASDGVPLAVLNVSGDGVEHAATTQAVSK
jgi:polygalacturonase